MKTSQTKAESPEWIEEQCARIQLEEDMQAEAEAKANKAWTINHQPCFRGRRIGFTIRAKGINGNIEVLLPTSSDVLKGREVAKLIVRAVNHSDKLAEALRDLTAKAFSDCDDDTLEASVVKSKQILAEYEAAQ